MSATSAVHYWPVPKSLSVPVHKYEIDPHLKLLDDGNFFAWTLTPSYTEGDIEFLAKLSTLPKHLRMSHFAFQDIKEIAARVLNVRSISTPPMRAVAFDKALSALKDLTDVDLTAHPNDVGISSNHFGHYQGPIYDWGDFSSSSPSENYLAFHKWFAEEFLKSVPHLQVLKLPPAFTDLRVLGTLLTRPCKNSLLGLSLAQCKEINDAALELFCLFPHLEELDLSGTGITEKAIPRLENLYTVRKLNLSGTKAQEARSATSLLKSKLV